MSNHVRNKPRTYRWLSWLLRLVIPVMVIPPLLWSLQEVPQLEPVSSRMQQTFNDYGYWVSGIDESEADMGPFNTWCIEGRNGPLGEKFSGFVFELPNGLLFPFVTFDEDFFGDPDDLYDEFFQEYPEYREESVSQGADFSSFNCDLKRPRTIQNMGIYGSGAILALVAALLGIFAAIRFDSHSENPIVEYTIIAGLAMSVMVVSGAWLYMVPAVVTSGLITAYLFMNRDVL